MKRAFRKTKKYHKRSTKFTRAVAKIAKRVTQKVAETKSAFKSVGSTNMFDQTVYARNLQYFIGQGTGSEQYVGEKIWLKNIHIKGQIQKNTAAANPLSYRLLVVRQSNFTWTTTQAAITYSDVFRSGSSNGAIPTLMHTDSHKVNVLYDSGPKYLNPAFTTATPKAAFDINLNINKRLYWTADSSGYFKGGDYFLILMCEDQSVANCAAIAFDFTVNYKDE